MLNTNLLRNIGLQMRSTNTIATTRHISERFVQQNRMNNASVRHATTTASPAAAQYHIPKRLVHIGLPVIVTALVILRVTDPSRAPPPVDKLAKAVQPSCNKVHARDLDRYIKANLDGISDEHAVAWNKMYNDFKTHRKEESEPARIEEENARILAQYAKIEDNKSRSTKVEGVMATQGGNRNISHRPDTVEEAVEEKAQSFKENVSARWAEVKRRITKVTKGSALF